MYVACSRATSANGLYIINKGDFQPTVPPGETESISLELARLESVKLEPRFLKLRDTERSNLQLIAHNVQSLKSHMDQIINDKVYLCSDFLLLNETWSTSNQVYNIPGFKEAARVNVEGEVPKPYGSICYINEKTLSKLGDNFNIIENLWRSSAGSISVAGFTFNEDKITVLSVYISPGCDMRSAVSQLRQCLGDNSVGRIIIAGDFNVNFNEVSTKKQLMLDFLQDYSLKSAMNDSFKSSTNNGTLIDNIFTNFDAKESGRYISHTSYHDPLYMIF